MPWLFASKKLQVTLREYSQTVENYKSGIVSIFIFYFKGRNFLRNKFLRKLLVQFSTPKILYLAEEISANCIHFLYVFFENCRVFLKK